MSTVYPIILCGGVGTRLWPLSRAQHPKQFQTISADATTTFFQATVQRHTGPIFARPLISVSETHLATVRRQLRAIQCDARIIAEPMACNTGPALLAAAFMLHKEDPDAVMIALPSDHIITGDFDAAVFEALPAAADGLIVTFGITPRYPESGYGYIVDGGSYMGYDGTRRVARFVEKPPVAVAASLIEAGGAYWASGISMFRASVLISEYRHRDHLTYDAVKAAVEKSIEQNGALLLNAAAYGNAANSSTESAIFEKSRHMALYPATIEWDDVGAWSSFHAIGKKGDNGNVASGDVVLVDTENSYVRGSDRLIAVVGMTDVVVVDTHDALLVTNRASSQKVKKVVELLATHDRPEVIGHRWLVTDWGKIGTLSEGDGFSLKHLVLNPGASVMFEAMRGKRSLLTIAEGIGTISMGGEPRVIAAGETVEIGPEMAAVISNSGLGELQAIEVATEVAAPVREAVIAVPEVVETRALPEVVESLITVNGSRHYA